MNLSVTLAPNTTRNVRRLAALFLISTPWAGSVTSKPPGEVVYLERGDLRVGLSPEWGGAVAELWKGPRNYVDDNDSGRLIQAAFFSHEDEAYNPTQGGASGNKAGGYLEFRKTAPNQAYSKARLLQWKARADQPARSEMELEQWTTIEDGHVELRYRWTNTGRRVQGAINQETSVIYLKPRPVAGPKSFNHVFTYAGDRPWSGDMNGLLHFDVTKREGDPDYKPFGHNFRATEYWIAMTDENGDGLTLFDPEYTDGHARRSYGIAPKYKMLKPYEIWGQDDPHGRNVRENTVYVIPGDWQVARQKLAAMYVNRREWNFSLDGASGWRARTREGGETGGKLEWKNTAAGQGFVQFAGGTTGEGIEPRGVNFSAAVYRGLKARARAPRAGRIQVLFKHDQDLTWNDARSRTIELAGGEAWQEIDVDLSGLNEWTGQIRGLRVEPVGGDIELAAAALSPRESVRWDFNRRLETEEWFPVRDGDLATPVSDGECLVGRATAPGPHRYIQPYLKDAPPGDGTRPRMTSPAHLNIEASAFPLFRMRMKPENTSAAPKLAWHTNAGRGLDRNYVATTTVTLKAVQRDGEFELYEADLSEHPEWKGIIEQLMLAPVVGKEAAFRIDWIELTKKP